MLVITTIVTFVVCQGVLLHTNLRVQNLSLDQQVESVAKCMKKVKDTGDHTGRFNSKDFYLMGHSAGAHLCSITALCDQYLKQEGMSNVDIKVKYLQTKIYNCKMQYTNH